MILVTRLDKSELFVNADYIQSVESRPDTNITLINGHSYIVRETDHEVVSRIVAYRRAVAGGNASPPLSYLHVVQNQ